MTLGEKIRELRSIKNISLREFAKLTGLSKTTLSDLENDNKNPSLESLNKIAYSLDISTSTLLKEVSTTSDIIGLINNKKSSLLTYMSKSEYLIKTLYKVKHKTKQELDEIALFLESYLTAKEKLNK